MSEVMVLPDEEQADGKSGLIESQLDKTRAIRDRIAQGLSGLFDDIMADFDLGKTNADGKRQRPTDIEEFDKITKLLLKTLGDNDKVDLVRLRIEADKGMNDDNIAAARACSSELLSQLGRQTVHPGAFIENEAIEGESVRVVSQEERDARLGFSAMDRFDDVEFSPGVLVQGRIEENTDAFYARLRSMTTQASEQALQGPSEEE